MGKEKALVLVFFSIALLAVFGLAMLMERPIKTGVENRFVDTQPVGYVEKGTFQSSPYLFAIVKGSIYETGSNMTVFGACQDGDGYLIPGSTANFTAWYPNGTLMLGPNASMVPIVNDSLDPTGRFMIHVNMTSTIGTYFTEMRCEYAGQYALAFGEWQNPEWVKKIGDTYENTLLVQQQLGNLSSSLNAFAGNVSNNFSQVLYAINNLNTSFGNVNVTTGDGTSSAEKLKEIYNLEGSIEHSIWLLDSRNPSYSLGSGMNGYRAVDMLTPDSVYVVGKNGTFGYFDGTSWVFSNESNVTWLGVSMLPATTPYAWLFGRTGPDFAPVEIYFNLSGATPIYSPNGGPSQTINETWFSSLSPVPTAFVDGRIFRRPNDPGASFYAYILTDTGVVAFSDDQGQTWHDDLAEHGVSYMSGGWGRISTVIDNLDNGVTNGYRLAMVTAGGGFAYFNGTNYTVRNIADGSFTDVALVYSSLAYVVGINMSTNRTAVWRFDGQNLTQVFSTTNVILPAGIAASSRDDVWVATADPSVFFHFDGFKWAYQTFPYSKGLGAVISFGSGGDIVGLHDITMSSGREGFAVGDDGLILRYYSLMDRRFDEVLAGLNNASFNVNLTPALQAIANLTNITLQMNASFAAQVAGVDAKITQMNQSLNLKLDTVISNVTYTQNYLETVINPSLVGILAYLGIIDAKLNTTIQLQNQTLQLLNGTNQNVSVLVERSNRPHPWTTQ